MRVTGVLEQRLSSLVDTSQGSTVLNARNARVCESDVALGGLRLPYAFLMPERGTLMRW